jgi:methionyl-tRNA synthetase
MPEQSEILQQQGKQRKTIVNDRKEEMTMICKRLTLNERPTFPKRAVITAGMPYGNKNLHFGHVGGMFIHADIFARFLRDRIGKENVIFLSGTDCYGSPIMESYRKLQEEGYKGTIEDYVHGNHKKQKETLKKYAISLDFFGASALGDAGKIHKDVSGKVFQTLYENGYIKKLSVPQLYDEERELFLNGRQVIGKCPIPGCCSDKAYADECSLGHQFLPSELMNPISSLSGNVEWGVALPECEDLKDLTFWVWPESLWAPISFTLAYLKDKGKEGDFYRFAGYQR